MHAVYTRSRFFFCCFFLSHPGVLGGLAPVTALLLVAVATLAALTVRVLAYVAVALAVAVVAAVAAVAAVTVTVFRSDDEWLRLLRLLGSVLLLLLPLLSNIYARLASTFRPCPLPATTDQTTHFALSIWKYFKGGGGGSVAPPPCPRDW